MKITIPYIASATLLLALSNTGLANPTDPPPGDPPTVAPVSAAPAKEAARTNAISEPALEEEPVPAGTRVVQDSDEGAVSTAADGNPAALDSAAVDSAAVDSAAVDSAAVDSAAVDSAAVDSAAVDSAAKAPADTPSAGTREGTGQGTATSGDGEAARLAGTEENDVPTATNDEEATEARSGAPGTDEVVAAKAMEAGEADSAGTGSAETAEAAAEPPADDSTEVAEAAPALTLDDLAEMFKEQQRELARQSALLESQALRISTLTEELDAMKQAPAIFNNEEVVLSEADLEASEPASQRTAEPAPEQVAVAEDATAEDAEQDEKRRAAGESVAKAQSDDPTRALLSSFKGAWRLPGTDAALAIGGYVKSSVVYNNDPLEVKDRFIVGSIPVGDDAEASLEAQTSLTASQSRLNFDLREATDFGVLRAFVEGDFAGDGDTFRLRHSFGQWKKVLAGKTWSAFMDTQASPEEVDFEGLNGRINVRQSQFRVMPQFGEEYEFQFSMEDPNPQVQGASGISRNPDIIASGRFSPAERLHVKLSMIAREIRAQRSEQGSGVEKEYGFGTSISGRFRTPYWDERDQLMFQLNAGRGIGRYINDLSSIGNYDGIVNENNGKLELLDVYSGYASYQHWWGRQNLRSNFTLGFVHIDNPNFVDDDAYERTLRFATNLMWSPTPRIDLGVELLWGRRENVNGDNEAATQTQAAIRYRF